MHFFFTHCKEFSNKTEDCFASILILANIYRNFLTVSNRDWFQSTKLMEANFTYRKTVSAAIRPVFLKYITLHDLRFLKNQAALIKS